MDILGIVMSFFWPVVIFGGLGWMIYRRRSHGGNRGSKNNHAHDLFLSPADAMSQLYILFGVVFFGLTLLGLNRELSNPLSWQLIVFVTSAIALVAAYYHKLVYTLFFGLIGLVIWWPLQIMSWVDVRHLTIKPAIFILGPALVVAIYYILGRIHQTHARYKRFALVYSIPSLVFVTIFLFILSSMSGLSFLQEILAGKNLFSLWQASIGALLLLATFAFVIVYGLGVKAVKSLELLFWSVFVLLVLLMNFLPENKMFIGGYYYGSERQLSAAGYFWSVLSNALLFAELIGLIFIGYARRELWLINFGALGLFIFILVKYFDWFFSLMNKGLFFIGAGILLFVVGGFMEKKRRSLIADLKTVN